MNQAGEPGHDDYGLPRVEIEIPDDARELYRDVQAYHRELRALRRHERSLKWRAPFRRTGLVMPLVAGCLILAMFSALVLTMFSSKPYGSSLTGHTRASSAAGNGGPIASATSAPAVSAAPSQTAGARLPGQAISVAGKQVALRTLTSAALLIVPPRCGCITAVRQMLAQARSAGIPVYLIGSGATLAELSRLAAASSAGAALVATDSRNVLTSAYQPAGLTVLLVDSRGAVTVRPRLRPGFRLERQLQLLRPAG